MASDIHFWSEAIPGGVQRRHSLKGDREGGFRPTCILLGGGFFFFFGIYLNQYTKM
eukprot:NODE_7566_length_395_cov_13.604046_g5887_i0.p5 GENE.NODE_7566_length_395_cov_13.604046_g5887_i0~~NODE_7566_length_395_cov_13.604046_g5887_i0.p5  ORF type:complete len:56 (+),score=8.81 NODE_7566_length_395_cov_13.604046_g5887_i0:20-187(+)